MSLTLAYITNRRDCRIQWFYDAIQRQSNGSPPPIIVVDFYHGERDTSKGIWKVISQNTLHVPPKPNIWNGPYRVVKDQWFAASSQRNTAICLCRSTHIAFCDDLSSPCSTWLLTAQQAAQGNKIILGSYRKVSKMAVEDGILISHDDSKTGYDARWRYGSDAGPMDCSGQFMFGCSLVAPIEAFLTVNGFDENCDGCGGEDYCTGVRLENAGYKFAYSRQLLTYESDELHHAEPAFVRKDKGVSPRDKSHSLLEMAKQSSRCSNYFGEGGIRALRDHVLAGGEFPITKVPQHDFWDGQLISEMK